MPKGNRGYAGRLAVVIWMTALLTATAGWCAESRADKPAFDMTKERIGTLHLGMAAAKVDSDVTCPVQKFRERFEAATGEYVQNWKMPACGLELKMSAPRRKGPQTVAAVTVTAPSKLATSRGIHIGSTEAEVQAAYGDVRDEEGMSEAGRNFVAGSIYGGLMFDFENGVVKSMFLGAAAE